MARIFVRALVALTAFSFLVPASPAMAQPLPADVITIGSVSTSSNTVDVPVYIRDVCGTPLGIDQPAGSRIQAYSIKVDYAPIPAVQSVTFTRAGITSPLTPVSEFTPAAPGEITLIDVFNEATDLVPFVCNASVPGQQVAVLHFTLSPAATPGTLLALTLDSTVLTQLSNQGGTTIETASLGSLVLVNGAVTVTAPAVPAAQVPTTGQWGLIVLGLALIAIGYRAMS